MKGGHIVGKAPRVHRNLFPRHHAEHIVPQPLKIHVDIHAQGLKGLRLVPVGITDPGGDRLHHGPGIVYGRNRFKPVAVVPFPQLLRIHPVPAAEALHLFLRKADKFRQLSGIDHGELGKHIERGMSAVFLDRQDPRHIGEINIRLILQQIPQKIQISFLRPVILPILAENTVPFVDDHHKGPARKTVHILHGTHQIFRIKIPEIRIVLQDLPENRPPDQADHLIHIFTLAQKFLHVQKNHVILIQMRFKILRFRDLPPGKKLFGIAAAAVIGRQHGRGDGFSETPRAAYTDTFLTGLKN